MTSLPGARSPEMCGNSEKQRNQEEESANIFRSALQIIEGTCTDNKHYSITEIQFKTDTRRSEGPARKLTNYGEKGRHERRDGRISTAPVVNCTFPSLELTVRRIGDRGLRLDYQYNKDGKTITDLGSKETGKIWHRKPTPATNDGIIVNVVHGAAGPQSKTMRFLQVAFDSSGDRFLAGDHLGSIYVFNLNRNRFDLVQRTLQACTALAFNLHRKSEFLVALADYSVKCFDADNKELVSWMRGHDSTVTSISIHGSGRHAVTTSSETAQLWDLDTFQRKRKLNVRQSVGIQKVFFLPLSNTILSCFKDNSIFAWESDTLTCKYQLPAPDGGSVFPYKAFAITRDGRMLAAGGKSNNLHLWCLSSKQLLRILQMPSTVRSVRQLEFLPDNFDGGSSQVLGVLSQDGLMRFINIQTCKLVFDIGSHDDGIVTSSVSPNGRYIAGLMENGSINLYSVQALTKEINKPPPPLVKVVDLTKDKDSTGNKSAIASEKVNISAGRPCRPWKSKQEVVKTKYLQPEEYNTSDNKENETSCVLSKQRLRAILKGFGEYPAKYRMFIWRSLLHLPENHAAFSSLTDKGTHTQYLLLHREYPLKSMKLLRVLQR
ncbi:unnamed protein product [Ranitomeya imitator]|uniref:TBC1 domain family member 31 n=1 Tax=Ranitomeya imitator TaxID=111125 RepID=A0ABN9LEW7_9NEOB|nr:unnamed protein product [Ranitomeya imitator]